MKYRTYLLFGAPGAGKGTQGKILGTIPNLFHSACGDVFRKLRVTDPLGQTFLEYSSRGELVPDEATIELWRTNINQCVDDGSFNPSTDTLLLDGIPRNLPQARMLQDTLEVLAVFHLTCTDQSKLVERLQRRALHDNRLDDANLKTIQHRLQTYERETRPVLDFYGPRLVHEINALQTPIRVLADILQIIASG